MTARALREQGKDQERGGGQPLAHLSRHPFNPASTIGSAKFSLGPGNYTTCGSPKAGCAVGVRAAKYALAPPSQNSSLAERPKSKALRQSFTPNLFSMSNAERRRNSRNKAGSFVSINSAKPVRSPNKNVFICFG